VRQDGVVRPQRLPTTGRLGGSVGVPVEARPEGASAILPKWCLPTRLETRTKESNIYASVLVEKPTRVMKVSDAKRKQQHRPTMILR
jgi:hypothetical protein